MQDYLGKEGAEQFLSDWDEERSSNSSSSPVPSLPPMTLLSPRSLQEDKTTADRNGDGSAAISWRPAELPSSSKRGTLRSEKGTVLVLKPPPSRFCRHNRMKDEVFSERGSESALAVTLREEPLNAENTPPEEKRGLGLDAVVVSLGDEEARVRVEEDVLSRKTAAVFAREGASSKAIFAVAAEPTATVDSPASTELSLSTWPLVPQHPEEEQQQQWKSPRSAGGLTATAAQQAQNNCDGRFNAIDGLRRRHNSSFRESIEEGSLNHSTTADGVLCTDPATRARSIASSSPLPLPPHRGLWEGLPIENDGILDSLASSSSSVRGDAGASAWVSDVLVDNGDAAVFGSRDVFDICKTSSKVRLGVVAAAGVSPSRSVARGRKTLSRPSLLDLADQSIDEI